MKLHVLYNTPCTIELVMHIQMSWMKSIERLPLTPGARTTAESDGCTGETSALLCITLSRWGLHTQKLAVEGGWSSWEFGKGRWAGSNTVWPQMTFSHYLFFFCILPAWCWTCECCKQWEKEKKKTREIPLHPLWRIYIHSLDMCTQDMFLWVHSICALE